jgi:hypothetical protein
MNNTMRWAAASIVLAMAAVACSSSDSGSGGTGGSAGTGGEAGAAGTGGSGGTGGEMEGGAGTGGSAGSDGGDMCAANSADDACTACLKQNCCNEYSACDGVASCKSAYGDFSTCLASDTIDNCGVAFVTAANTDDGGASAANDVLTCAGTSCTSECAGSTGADAGTE